MSVTEAIPVELKIDLEPYGRRGSIYARRWKDEKTQIRYLELYPEPEHTKDVKNRHAIVFRLHESVTAEEESFKSAEHVVKSLTEPSPHGVAGPLVRMMCDTFGDGTSNVIITAVFHAMPLLAVFLRVGKKDTFHDQLTWTQSEFHHEVYVSPGDKKGSVTQGIYACLFLVYPKLTVTADVGGLLCPILDQAVHHMYAVNARFFSHGVVAAKVNPLNKDHPYVKKFLIIGDFLQKTMTHGEDRELEIAEKKEQLETLQKEVDEQRAELEGTKKRLHDVEEQLADMKLELNTKTNDLYNVRIELEHVTSELEETKEEADEEYERLTDMVKDAEIVASGNTKTIQEMSRRMKKMQRQMDALLKQATDGAGRGQRVGPKKAALMKKRVL